jgi:RNA polymerase sigma-70 factor (ECF subfamily)
LISQEIIEECRKGNLRNFRKLVTGTSPIAFSVAFRILGDEEKAKDVVQETMITVWQKIKSIKSSESFNSWMYKIVINKCYDQIRMAKKTQETNADEKTWAAISNHLAGGGSTELENSETGLIIRSLTERLSPRQKMVFILCELEEMSHDEAAEITGLSKRNLKANLHFARKNITEMIQKYL